MTTTMDAIMVLIFHLILSKGLQRQSKPHYSCHFSDSAMHFGQENAFWARRQEMVVRDIGALMLPRLSPKHLHPNLSKRIAI